MSISVPRDQNRVPGLVGTLNTDGVTPVAITATNNALSVSDGTTGSSLSFKNSQRDANRVPALWATSSADGITPIPVYADSTGKLLVQST